MRSTRITLSIFLALCCIVVFTPMAQAQAANDFELPSAPHAKEIHLKHVLVIGETKGFEHDSVTDAMVAIANMGKKSGLWDTEIRTDTELLTKKDLGRNAKN
ncbi:MAG: ThuA domain-containing protein, partial [Acidobacteriota bacterium]